MAKNVAERIIQIVLLLIIAAGFGGIIYTLGGSGSSAGGPPGGMPGASGGAASGMPAAFGGSSSNAAAATVAVEAEVSELGDVNQFIRVNGDVVSDVSVDIYPDVSGKLIERKVQLGSYVKKGDIIAVVDPSTPGVVYSKSSVVSTISGTVTAVNATVGDTVSTGSSIAEVGDLSNLSLVTYVPERYISYLKTGLTAEVTFEAFEDRVFQARVVQLNPVVDTSSRSLEIKLEILNPDSGIRAGMFASMKLITRESTNCISVLNTALSSYYEDTVVFVLNDDDTVERRVVTTGLVSDSRTEITSGLEEGEIVITQGTSSLTDGTAVRVVNELESREG